MFDLASIQAALREFGIDGWLLYLFRGSNPLAERVLQLTSAGSRRCFYFVPARGTPRKLVHRIEAGALAHLPGETLVYLARQELTDGLFEVVKGAKTIAMEYSPQAANPYVARVDAGTIELVRSCGTEVVSSGDLVQQFEATWSDRQWELHQEAAIHTNQAFDTAWRLIADRARAGDQLLETEVQAVIINYFSENGLVTSHPPIVAAGPHSGDPHFEPGAELDLPLTRGEFVLIDLWAKMDDPVGVYSDLTRVAYVDAEVPSVYTSVFEIVAAARDAAIDLVRTALAANQGLAGWQVDRAAREVIEAAGYGGSFIHRTGHSIGVETHGNGANMDDLETHDERRILPRTCFSIEPGIYLPDFGIRSETNIYVDAHGTVHVTCRDLQSEVLPLLAQY